MLDDKEDGRRFEWQFIALLAFILLLLVADLAADLANHAAWSHMASEIAAGGLALWGVAALGSRLRAERARSAGLAGDLAHAREEARRWASGASDTLRSLGGAVDTQFARWELTEAERNVAFMLLKGLRLKEIAAARATSERTVRQQALSVYRKARVDGRTELAGFFLEGLHMPDTPKAS